MKKRAQQVNAAIKTKDPKIPDSLFTEVEGYITPEGAQRNIRQHMASYNASKTQDATSRTEYIKPVTGRLRYSALRVKRDSDRKVVTDQSTDSPAK